MFIDFEEIEEDQDTQSPTPSNRRQDHEDHSSHPIRAHTHGKTYQTGTHDNVCPKPLKIRVYTLRGTGLRKDSYKDPCTQHFPYINKWTSDKLLMKGFRILFT